MTDEDCARCGKPAVQYDYKTDSTFWGAVKHEHVEESGDKLKILSRYVRHSNNRVLYTDENIALCADCWSDFVSLFLKNVPFWG